MSRNMRKDLYKKREEYLSKLSEEQRAITIANWNKKALEKRQENKGIKKENDIVSSRLQSLLESDLVVFDDEEENETVLDRVLTTAVANLITNPKTSMRDVLEMQKVVTSDTEESNSGTQIVIVTNGQDLGD